MPVSTATPERSFTVVCERSRCTYALYTSRKVLWACSSVLVYRDKSIDTDRTRRSGSCVPGLSITFMPC